MQEDTILKVKNLYVELNNIKILENINFELKKGEVLTIIGPNGAGKTVLLKTLLGIYPYKGEIFWKKDIKLGYVPQRVPFLKTIPLTVKEFFLLKNYNQTKIIEILKNIGIRETDLNKKIGDLSSGQFQRVLIGFALIKDPQVLLFDEPVSGIDIEGQETIYNFLERLHARKNITILMVSHDLNIVYKFSTKVLCLSHRKMVCIGKPQAVLNSENLAKLFNSEIKVYKHF